MKDPILHFFLLILEILFNFVLDNVYKCGEFIKTLLKKSLKFVLHDEVSLVLFFYYFLLLPSKFNSILKE